MKTESDRESVYNIRVTSLREKVYDILPGVGFLTSPSVRVGTTNCRKYV